MAVRRSSAQRSGLLKTVHVPSPEPAGLGRQLRNERAQFGRGVELRNRIELLERAGEGIRQAPHGPGRELRVFRLKVELVDVGQKAPWSVERAVDERVVEDQLGALVRDLGLPPRLHLALQRLKVSLNAVTADRKRVDQVEAPRCVWPARV